MEFTTKKYYCTESSAIAAIFSSLFFIFLLLLVLNLINLHFVIIKYLGLDFGTNYQTQLQEPSSTLMEGIYIFNSHLLFIIIIIVFFVAWLLSIVVMTFLESKNSGEGPQFTHNNLIEIIWTSIPALILFSISAPSFSLLYSMDEITDPELTLKVFGHQWYWSYEISDFNSCSGKQHLKYSAYMLPDDILKEKNLLGFFRNLETNKRVVLPAGAHIRLLITALDVLHSWAIPSFGIKVDACPGRLNQASLFVKKLGLFFGQCSEVCGVGHAFMPISVLVVKTENFHSVLEALLFDRAIENARVTDSTYGSVWVADNGVPSPAENPSWGNMSVSERMAECLKYDNMLNNRIGNSHYVMSWDCMMLCRNNKEESFLPQYVVNRLLENCGKVKLEWPKSK